MLESLKHRFKNNKLVSLIAGGAFLFFLIKGIIWLIIFALAGWGLMSID